MKPTCPCLAAIIIPAFLLCGCTVENPIKAYPGYVPKPQIDSAQLDIDWKKYQDYEATHQADLLQRIKDADNVLAALQDKLNNTKPGFWYQAIQALNDPNNSGIWTTLGTVLLGTLGVGFGAHNLRLDRKIANPEIPADDNGGETDGNADDGAPQNLAVAVNPAPAQYADLALEHALKAVAA